MYTYMHLQMATGNPTANLLARRPFQNHVLSCTCGCEFIVVRLRLYAGALLTTTVREQQGRPAESADRLGNWPRNHDGGHFGPDPKRVRPAAAGGQEAREAKSQSWQRQRPLLQLE